MAIKLAYEMPHAYLDTYKDKMPYGFCLAHMMEDNEQYRNFFLQLNKEEKHIILDNGVFELGHPIGVDRILAVFKMFSNPSSVTLVATDSYANGPETTKAVMDFIGQVRSALTGGSIPTIMAVAQGKTWEEWVTCYNTFNNENIDIIGVPYLIPFDVPGHLVTAERLEMSSSNRQMWRRIFLFEKLIETNNLQKIPHHLLGCSNPLELYYQSAVPEIISMDTSFPFVQALGGKASNECGLDLGEEKLSRTKDFFEKSFSADVAKLIDEHLFTMQIWARGRRP